MAKKVYKKRYYRKKGRWSANINSIDNNSLTISTGNFYISEVLTTNPAQTNTTVSQQYTVKNFELSFSLDLDSTIPAQYGEYIENIVFYIIYVPQGITVNSNLPIQHPEWIMSYKFMGSIDMETEGNNTQLTYIAPKRGPYRIKTRMARRLQTGDQIVLLITGRNRYSADLNANFSGLLRWWTKAN